MSYLLDTHVLLWWLSDSPRLSVEARRLFENSSQAFFVSPASIWEIRIKERLGKLVVPTGFTLVLSEQGFEELPITHSHAHGVGKLPLIHRDPFDRMLIAQAKSEGMTLVSHDPVMARYGISTQIV